MAFKRCIVTIGEDMLINMKFKYFVKELGQSKFFTLKRKHDEPVENLIKRIGLNLIGKDKKRDVPDIYFTLNDIRISNGVKIIDLFKDNVVFHIDEDSYSIDLNPPEVIKLTLPKLTMVGFSIVPCLEVCNCRVENCKFAWYMAANLDGQWTKLSEETFYKPSSDDIGKFLMLECTPCKGSNDGLPAKALSNLIKAKTDCIFEERRPASLEKNTNGFRCISYNILADLYADPDMKTRKTQFPYCPKEALRFDYRKVLLLEELQSYLADIYCLQEVDQDFFSKDLTTLLTMKNYGLIFDEKVGKREGLAIAFNKEKFTLANRYKIAYGEQLTSSESCQDLKDMISQNKMFYEKISNMGTVLQVVELDTVGSDKRRKLFVANTHLYYAPGATILRLMQSLIGVRYLEEITSKCEEDCAVIWCGDFNSSPQYATYHFLSQGVIKEDHKDWSSNETFALPGECFRHKLPLKSAYGCPDFTTFTKDFVDCLDYIFYDTENLRVASVVLMPERERVSKHEALPSYEAPSDHLPLIAELEWIG